MARSEGNLGYCLCHYNLKKKITDSACSHIIEIEGMDHRGLACVFRDVTAAEVVAGILKGKKGMSMVVLARSTDNELALHWYRLRDIIQILCLLYQQTLSPELYL